MEYDVLGLRSRNGNIHVAYGPDILCDCVSIVYFPDNGVQTQSILYLFIDIAGAQDIED